MAKPRSPRRTDAAPTSKPANDIPALEWASAAVGLALAATAIGLTTWDAVFGVDGPPAIEVRLKSVNPTPHGYVVEVEAFNHGGSPAAQVQIEGVLAGEAERETANATIDYIPEQSGASGGLIFERDPRGQSLKLRAKGFADTF